MQEYTSLSKHVSDWINLFNNSLLSSVSDRPGRDELKTNKSWPLASWNLQSSETDKQGSKH